MKLTFILQFPLKEKLKLSTKNVANQQYVKQASPKHIVKKYLPVRFTCSIFLYCLLAVIFNSWLKICCSELKKGFFVQKKCAGFQQFFQRQSYFFHTQQFNLTGFLHRNQ